MLNAISANNAFSIFTGDVVEGMYSEGFMEALTPRLLLSCCLAREPRVARRSLR